MKTYWLYYGGRLLTGVRFREDATRDEVVAHALEQHEKGPTIGPRLGEEAPFEFANRLRRANVITQGAR